MSSDWDKIEEAAKQPEPSDEKDEVIFGEGVIDVSEAATKPEVDDDPMREMRKQLSDLIVRHHEMEKAKADLRTEQAAVRGEIELLTRRVGTLTPAAMLGVGTTTTTEPLSAFVATTKAGTVQVIDQNKITLKKSLTTADPATSIPETLAKAVKTTNRLNVKAFRALPIEVQSELIPEVEISEGPTKIIITKAKEPKK